VGDSGRMSECLTGPGLGASQPPLVISSTILG